MKHRNTAIGTYATADAAVEAALEAVQDLDKSPLIEIMIDHENGLSSPWIGTTPTGSPAPGNEQ